ncbi:flagellar hook-associated protein FlgL [Solibacillus sp. FSL H8-0523]|uniref:flagellar hook-associated protein FlgL n=1 Tax=Solibacillus sp. FSL H8-0523 TaxID=2954511 RepID=UPI003101083F
MRVTQSMLSNNMLRNLNTSYNKMSKLQDQMNSGSLINRPSDDPVIAVKGMGYRVDLDKNAQYQRNINEAHTWVDSTDEALDQVGTSLIRVKELIVQAANDTNTPDERKKIGEEISQIREQFRDLANSKIGDNYIFSGTYTNRPLFSDGAINPEIAGQDGLTKSIDMNVFDGISMKVNTTGVDYFQKVDEFMGQLEGILNNKDITSEEIGAALGAEFENAGGTAKIPALDGLHSTVLTMRAEIGAKQNRLELMQNRLEIQELNVTKQLSENEDTDYAKAITDMTTAESIHQASLSVGAKIIQQTLVDFIR